MLKKLILLSIIPFIMSVYTFFANNTDAFLYSLLTVFCIVAFSVFYEKTHFISKKTYYAVIGFIYLSIFLGRTLSFYFIFPIWDKFLHFLSGFILFSIGMQIARKFNINNKNIVMYFAFLFATSFASFWEIYEFFIDALLKTNAQGGSLTDTMYDIILGSFSALIMLIIKKIKNRCL